MGCGCDNLQNASGYGCDDLQYASGCGCEDLQTVSGYGSEDFQYVLGYNCDDLQTALGCDCGQSSILRGYGSAGCDFGRDAGFYWDSAFSDYENDLVIGHIFYHLCSCSFLVSNPCFECHAGFCWNYVPCSAWNGEGSPRAIGFGFDFCSACLGHPRTIQMSQMTDSALSCSFALSFLLVF